MTILLFEHDLLGREISEEEYRTIIKKYLPNGFSIEEIQESSDPKYGKVYHAKNISKFSKHVAYNKTILVGDAYCFSDPVFSTGTRLAMSESSYIAAHMNNDTFSIEAYKEKTGVVIKNLLKGISLWYSANFKNDENRQYIQETVLNGNFLNENYAETHLFSDITEQVRKMECEFANEDIHKKLQ